MPIAFDAQNLQFDYEGIAALRGLSLRVEAGERVVLLGANGSGKSTLLRVLNGLYFPKSGVLHFDGVALTAERLRDENFVLTFRRRVALVFQNPDVQLFNPTVFDEVAYGPLQLQWERNQLVSRVERTLEWMAISHLRDRSPYRLSGGEKKRVALASVLVLDPDVLLLDEPTASLDPRSQSQLVDLIQQWKGRPKTVITATHQVELVESIADKVFVLEAGAVVAEGSPAEILSNRDLLLRTNLIHVHRHSHEGVTHSHPHFHGHSHPGQKAPGET